MSDPSGVIVFTGAALIIVVFVIGKNILAGIDRVCTLLAEIVEGGTSLKSVDAKLADIQDAIGSLQSEITRRSGDDIVRELTVIGRAVDEIMYKICLPRTSEHSEDRADLP